MIKTLSELADVRSGYAFRGRPARVDRGGIMLVQMRDLDSATGWVQESNLEQIEPPPNWEKYRLRLHDVVLAARGDNNQGAQFGGNTEALPASNLLVLRIRPGCELHPFFLVWYLNLPQTRAQLRQMRTGSNIPFIPIESLKGLPVPVPSNEMQQHIFGLNELFQTEQRLMTQLQERKKELMAGVFQCLLTGQIRN
jgi:hypothetical protein